MNYTIFDEMYEIIDSLEYITMADSFVKNKIGTGHGEAKLYVGNIGTRINEFFGDYSGECFFVGEDLKKYLANARDEFYNPQQAYDKKQKMAEKYERAEAKVAQFGEGILKFQVYRVDVMPPRVYINSNSEYYDFMREIGLVNISYLSIMKLKSKMGKICYYYRMFIDYKADFVKYISPVEQLQTKAIEESLTIPNKTKEYLIKARVGQGEYRRKLLEDCLSTCPFTLVNDERLLIASHIKPWAKCDDKEKLDYKNGFIFTPTYDKLFDQGFITFDEDKKLRVSPWLSPMNQKRLAIFDGKIIDKLPLDKERLKYLKYHMQYEFKN